jgi:chromatin assembly factor 1 subunit B
MKSIPLIVNWHDASAPIYSAHFEPNGKRLATAGGDNNVRVSKDDLSVRLMLISLSSSFGE